MTTEGTLLEFIDHTSTSFGKRQIKRWLLSPLLDPEKINERLDAVEDLMKLNLQVDLFRSKLSKLPDLERTLAKVFIYSVKDTTKAIYFEKVQFQKLKEFKILMQNFKDLQSIIAPLRMHRNKMKSKRLKQLLHFTNESFLDNCE